MFVVFPWFSDTSDDCDWLFRNKDGEELTNLKYFLGKPFILQIFPAFW